MEEDKNHRGGDVPGSCTYTLGDTPGIFCFEFYGTHREKKCFAVIRKVSGTKLQVAKPGVPAPRVLHRYGGEGYETDCKVHEAPAG